MAAPVTYELAVHQGREAILIRFPYDRDLQSRVQQLRGARWSRTNKAWLVPDIPQYRQRFGRRQRVIGKAAWAGIHPVNQPALKKLVETLQLRAYSAATIQTYRNEFAQLLHLLKAVPADSLLPDRLRAYVLYCINELKLSEHTVHNRLNALKFYYEQVLGRDKMFVGIPRPKKPQLLPNMLAVIQVERLFAQLENLKHKTMLVLAYSAGLRVSEIVNLRIRDIHFERMVIHIKEAKGKKDRMVALSSGILELLRKYYRAYRPTDWLFNGQLSGEPYSSHSLQQIFHRVREKAASVNRLPFIACDTAMLPTCTKEAPTSS